MDKGDENTMRTINFSFTDKLDDQMGLRELTNHKPHHVSHANETQNMNYHTHAYTRT